MIKEFALDPEAITASYREFCYFTEKFNISQGRVISKFPNKWRKMVCESAQRMHGGKVEFTKIVERLKTFGDEVIFDAGRPSGDGTKNWIDRAVEEDTRESFTAIISSSPSTYQNVLHMDKIDETNPIFAATRQWTISRNSEEMIACADFLLRHSKVVKLVDPFFDLKKAKYRRPFQQVLARLAGRFATVEIHASDNMGDAELIRSVQLHLKMLPEGVIVKLYMHDKKLMHNRFIITEHGGLIYGAGLSDNEDEDSTPNDEVVLMDSSVRTLRWNDYSNAHLLGEWSVLEYAARTKET